MRIQHGPHYRSCSGSTETRHGRALQVRLFCRSPVGAQKYVPFLHDNSFNASWRDVTTKADERWIGGTPDIRWRVHVCIWAAEQCLRLDGDFAEFGVNTGLLSSMILKETDFDASGKKFFLFDTYEGIPIEMASEGEAKGVEKMNKNMYTGNANNDNVLEFVQEVFAPHPGVEIVQGLLPKSIEQASFDKLSYVSIPKIEKISIRLLTRVPRC